MELSYPTTNEKFNPKAFAIRKNVESCISVCPFSSDDTYSRFLPIFSASAFCVIFCLLRSSFNNSA